MVGTGSETATAGSRAAAATTGSSGARPRANQKQTCWQQEPRFPPGGRGRGFGEMWWLYADEVFEGGGRGWGVTWILLVLLL